ncbi:hypothetical protein [Spirochaeta isovalerica]|uniref:DUF1616 domain-containing protein n=1 Tax=Spirochaeta isovalerica TaxID=150 RepID=A0A841R4F4_9SPIO|nr:hypothetical protein [Spirochaeta isovalerica]MBB6478673.1 hypothetical protein [Spirochaeta isovalerica]
MAENWETAGLDDSHYHSSRKERHHMGNIKEPVEKKGFFARNPSFRIVLIDLIFIVIISGVIVPFIYKREGTVTIEEYSLKLKTFQFDDQIMATLTIRNKKDSGDSNSLIEALFYMEESEAGITAQDLLPDEKEERILKAALPDDGSGYVYCRIEMRGITKVLKKKIS